MSDTLIQVNHMFKSFGSTKAVSDVSLSIKKGQIHGLIGENGSGKSTLSSIIAGSLGRDSGEILKNASEYSPASMVDAQQNGVAMIVQEMGTIPGITVADNIFIGKEKRFEKLGLVSTKAMNKAASEVLYLIGAPDINPESIIDTLNFEDRKIVEIARAIYDKPDLFIVDETTTALSQRGRKILYSIMENLVKEKKSVLFISHDLDELISLCTELTVLRDGHLIGTLEKDKMDPDTIKSMMVGREITGSYYRADFECTYDDEVVLKGENMTGNMLKGISLELHKGEILGICGLTESGIHELGRLLYGIDKPISGKVTLGNGQKVKNPYMAVEKGLGYVSKNRDQDALMLRASIRDNIVLPSCRNLEKAAIISKKKENALTNEQVEALSIKCSSIDQSIASLSGGNKQKVSFGKWIGKGSEILILDCPTRGVDIGVKASMYKLISDLKAKKKAIVLISEELPELIGMSDRILIIKDGKLTGECKRSKQLNENSLIKLMI